MAFQRTFRRSGDHHADLEALDGVDIKIGESFKPPRKVTLPVGWHQKDPSEVLSLTYDFSMEKKIIEKIETERLEKQRKKDEERAIIVEKEKAKSIENGKEEQDSLNNPTTSANSIFSNVGTEILMPTAASNSGHKRNESFGKNAIDFSDFEGTATSPFELVELQTINDMDELKNCFQPSLTTSITSNVVEANANSTLSSPVSSMGVTYVTSVVAATTSSIENSSKELSVHSTVGGVEKSLISSAITTTGSSQRNLNLTNSVPKQPPEYSRMPVNSTFLTQIPVNGNAKSELSKSIPDLSNSALVDVNNVTATEFSRQTQFTRTSGLPTQPLTSVGGLPYSLPQPSYLGGAYGIPNQTMYTNSTPHVSSPLYTNVTVSSNSVVGSPTNVPLSPPSNFDHSNASQRPSHISIGYTSYNMRDTTQSYNTASSSVNTSSESKIELPAVSSTSYTVPVNPVSSVNANTSYNTGFQIAQHNRNTKLPPLDIVTSTSPQVPPVPLRSYQTTTPSDLGRSSSTLSGPSIGLTSSGHQPTPPQGFMAPVSSFSMYTSSPMPTRPEYSTGDQNGSCGVSNAKRRVAQRRSNITSQSSARMLKRHSSPLPPIGLQDTNNDKETNSYQSALPDPQPLLSETDKKFVANVSSMGFPAPRVARAVQKFGQNEREIFDFLFVVEELCKTGYTGDESEVALCFNDMKKTKALEFLKLVKTFKELGFKEESIHEALAAADNDSEKALDYLTAGV